MARHRVNTPDFENPETKRAKRAAKKKYTIFRTVSWIYVAILFTVVIVSGLNRHDSLIYGWSYVILGIFSFLLTVFLIYTLFFRGWSKAYYYWRDYELYPELMESRTGKETFKEEMAEHVFLEIITCVVYLGLTVALLVIGIRALLGL